MDNAILIFKKCGHMSSEPVWDGRIVLDNTYRCGYCDPTGLEPDCQSGTDLIRMAWKDRADG